MYRLIMGDYIHDIGEGDIWENHEGAYYEVQNATKDSVMLRCLKTEGFPDVDENKYIRTTRHRTKLLWGQVSKADNKAEEE